jgi:hypothetical protein
MGKPEHIPPREYDWAYRRALVALQLASDDACRLGWERLEHDFGYDTAAYAWRKAAADLDAAAEAASIAGGPTICQCDAPAIDVDVDSVCRRCGRTVNFASGPSKGGESIR